METPLLFIIYRRPETTQFVFDEIRKIKPKQLFVAADGPRIGEESKCFLTRNIISQQVDWDCELKLLYQENNLGGKWGGHTALEWFFNHVDEGIILEDDDVPDQSFFPYCEELLKKYRDDNRIGAISGDNFQFGNNKISHSYYFSKYFHGWGWATWKRVWEGFDITLKDWQIDREENWHGDFLDDPREYDFWKSTLDRMYSGADDAWDYQLTYYLWKNKMLNIIPSVNLVTNIGTEDSTHAMSSENPMVCLKREPVMLPLKHPETIERNKAADTYTLRFYL